MTGETTGKLRALTADEQRLAADYYGYALYMAAKYRGRLPDDVADGACVDSLIAAVVKHDRERPFRPFLNRCLLNALNIARAASATARRGGKVLTGDLPHDVAARDAAGLDFEALEAVRKAWAALPERESRIVAERIDGETHREIGRREGVSRQYVNIIEMRAYSRLRVSLAAFNPAA